MSNRISSLVPPPIPALPGATSAGASESSGSSFQDLLLDSIDQVNSMQQDADRAVETIATGGDITPAEVLTAVQKADMAFRVMMQMRTKLLQAFQEVQNLRV